jgi:hypothetical protein
MATAMATVDTVPPLFFRVKMHLSILRENEP